MIRFGNRREAGRALARALAAYADRPEVIVLGLPRGGVPVAFEVAQALRAPLDVFLVRKLGVPGHEELAMGAIASGGELVLNDEVVRGLGPTHHEIEGVARRERQELERRERAYRGHRAAPRLEGRTVILVDDGLATGSSMRAAVRAVRRAVPHRIIVAVPVAPAETCEVLSREADHVVCLATPEPFLAVGLWYVDFAQTTDDEVRALLAQAERGAARSGETTPAGGP